MYAYSEKINSAQSIYKSNVSVASLKFWDHFDQKVAVILMNNNVNINGALYVCLTPQSLQLTLRQLQRKFTNETFTYSQTAIGIAIDNTLHKCDAMVMCGFASLTYIIAKEDLEPIHDITDSFCIMHASATGNLSLNKAFELMKNKTVYFIGGPPRTQQSRQSVMTIKRQSQKGIGYEAIKLFLTKENAQKNNKEQLPITQANIATMYNYYKGLYALILEPHENYWIEFGVEALRV